MSDPYAESGVHLDRAERLVAAIQALAHEASRPEVVAGVGGFAGAFRLEGRRRPLLVAATDGVGTKLLLARQAGYLGGLGQDLAAMVLNDLVCLGAEPLFFLDYLGVGELQEAAMLEVLAGLARVLAEEGCALLGGETAELPGLYAPEDFDLVGFAVGVVEAERLIRPRGAAGDVVIGLPSSGLHANGFSLVRRILAEHPDIATPERFRELLTPTRLYVRPILRILAAFPDVVHGLAHITGGGLPGNAPRALLPGHGLELRLPPEPELERLLRRTAGLSRQETLPIWNAGVGFVLVVAADAADAVWTALEGLGEQPLRLGRVVEGTGVVCR